MGITLRSSAIAVAMAASLTMITHVARADTVTASGQGWCNVDGSCNATTGINNTFAGQFFGPEFGPLYRNWFRFSIPTLATITSATINIWNAASNATAEADPVYSLYAGASLSYTGLKSGSALGEVSVFDADTGIGHWESIALNAAGLAALNAAMGGSFLFGGDVSPISGTGDIQIFGFTTGLPAAYLELSAAPIPEPESYAMLLAGLGVLLAVARRRKAAKAA